MTKPAATAASAAEAGFATMMAPMQESLDRLHRATEKMSSTYADIATNQLEFLQKTVFESLIEYQGLTRVRNPAEFFELSNEFAWEQAERSLKAFSELGTELCGCWLDALKASPLQVKETKGRAVH